MVVGRVVVGKVVVGRVVVGKVVVGRVVVGSVVVAMVVVGNETVDVEIDIEGIPLKSLKYDVLVKETEELLLAIYELPAVPLFEKPTPPIPPVLPPPPPPPPSAPLPPGPEVIEEVVLFIIFEFQFVIFEFIKEPIEDF